MIVEWFYRENTAENRTLCNTGGAIKQDLAEYNISIPVDRRSAGICHTFYLSFAYIEQDADIDSPVVSVWLVSCGSEWMGQ